MAQIRKVVSMQRLNPPPPPKKTLCWQKNCILRLREFAISFKETTASKFITNLTNALEFCTTLKTSCKTVYPIINHLNWVCTSNHMLRRAIWDKLPEGVFENFEIARVNRRQLKKKKKSPGWFIPEIARNKHAITV